MPDARAAPVAEPSHVLHDGAGHTAAGRQHLPGCAEHCALLQLLSCPNIKRHLLFDITPIDSVLQNTPCAPYQRCAINLGNNQPSCVSNSEYFLAQPAILCTQKRNSHKLYRHHQHSSQKRIVGLVSHCISDCQVRNCQPTCNSPDGLQGFVWDASGCNTNCRCVNPNNNPCAASVVNSIWVQIWGAVVARGREWY